MDTIKSIVLNELPEDVILFLTKNESGISLPRLDGLYSRANWIHVNNSWGLLTLVKKMCDDGLIRCDGAVIVRGPNWKEATFMLERKYSFN